MERPHYKKTKRTQRGLLDGGACVCPRGASPANGNHKHSAGYFPFAFMNLGGFTEASVVSRPILDMERRMN